MNKLMQNIAPHNMREMKFVDPYEIEELDELLDAQEEAAELIFEMIEAVSEEDREEFSQSILLNHLDGSIMKEFVEVILSNEGMQYHQALECARGASRELVLDLLERNADGCCWLPDVLENIEAKREHSLAAASDALKQAFKVERFRDAILEDLADSVGLTLQEVRGIEDSEDALELAKRRVYRMYSEHVEFLDLEIRSEEDFVEAFQGEEVYSVRPSKSDVFMAPWRSGGFEIKIRDEFHKLSDLIIELGAEEIDVDGLEAAHDAIFVHGEYLRDLLPEQIRQVLLSE